jgi:hypothetical protein
MSPNFNVIEDHLVVKGVCLRLTGKVKTCAKQISDSRVDVCVAVEGHGVNTRNHWYGIGDAKPVTSRTRMGDILGFIPSQGRVWWLP